MNRFHVGRSWTGHTIEDECPCSQEVCGLVQFDVMSDCPEHGRQASKTMRQGHLAVDCPGKKEGS